MAYGFKISLPGKDVTSIDPLDFSLNTAYNMMKVGYESSGQVVADDTYDESPLITTVAYLVHNLHYKPIVLTYYNDSDINNYWYLAPNQSIDITSPLRQIGIGVTHYDTDTVQLEFLYISAQFPSPVATAIIKYHSFVLVDPLKDAWTDGTTGGTVDGKITAKPEYGCVISREGKSVNEFLQDSDYIFTSYFFTPKIVRVYYFEDAGNIEHGLGFIPMFIPLTVTAGVYQTTTSKAYVDSTKVYGSANTYVIILGESL